MCVRLACGYARLHDLLDVLGSHLALNLLLRGVNLRGVHRSRHRVRWLRPRAVPGVRAPSDVRRRGARARRWRCCCGAAVGTLHVRRGCKVCARVSVDGQVAGCWRGARRLPARAMAAASPQGSSLSHALREAAREITPQRATQQRAKRADA